MEFLPGEEQLTFRLQPMSFVLNRAMLSGVTMSCELGEKHS